MALFSNMVSFLLFTILLFLSLQIHARDSQFFSKVTHSINNKEKSEPVMMNKRDEQDQPVFMSETDNNYGLYGHDESAGGQFPPDTTTYQPYKTESEEEYMRKYPNNKYSYYNRNNYSYKDSYGNDLDSTRYVEGGYEDVSNNQVRKKNQKLYNSNNGGYGRYDKYNGGRQGMSDTRFMGGNGKYYHENNNSMEGYQNEVGLEGNNRDDFQP